LAEGRLLKTKQRGWKSWLLMSTGTTRNTLTESKCRTDVRELANCRFSGILRKDNDGEGAENNLQAATSNL
jgi:hypothetical protein